MSGYSFSLGTPTATLPKLEGRITVPASTIAINEGAGTFQVSITAADYYLTSSTALLSTITSTIQAHGSATLTYTSTLDDDTDGSTGKPSIAVATGSFALNWLSATTLRDALGFIGNRATAATQMADYHSRY